MIGSCQRDPNTVAPPPSLFGGFNVGLQSPHGAKPPIFVEPGELKNFQGLSLSTVFKGLVHANHYFFIQPG